MKHKLCFSLTIIALLSILGTAMAVSFSAKTEGSADEAQFSGKYKLDGSTDFSISAKLDSGSLFKGMKAKGSGFNSLDESVSTKENSVQNTILSSGSMSTSSSSSGSNDGVVVDHDASLDGDMGFIGTKAVSSSNRMIVAGGFAETGALNEQISSSSGNAAYVGGTVSSGGVNLLNEGISQAVYSSGMEMEVEGISMTSADKIGKFGLVATNQANAAIQAAPTGNPVGFNTIKQTSDPTLPGEVMTNPAYMGSSSSYKLLNYKIGSTPRQLYLKADQNLIGEGLDSIETGKSIATAAETWDRSTSKELFNNNVIISSNAQADKGDGYSVHAFIPISGNAIAYARTWTLGGIVADSDVCYNTNRITQDDGSATDMIWSTAWDNNWVSAQRNSGGKYPASYKIDVQSIALHELGHTVGLGDLYLYGSTDWNQAMNSYNGPQRYLGFGDITGLQKKYGR